MCINVFSIMCIDCFIVFIVIPFDPHRWTEAQNHNPYGFLFTWSLQMFSLDDQRELQERCILPWHGESAIVAFFHFFWSWRFEMIIKTKHWTELKTTDIDRTGLWNGNWESMDSHELALTQLLLLGQIWDFLWLFCQDWGYPGSTHDCCKEAANQGDLLWFAVIWDVLDVYIYIYMIMLLIFYILMQTAIHTPGTTRL